MTLYEKLAQAGYRVWYDMEEEDLTERGMEEGVSRCRVVLIFLSDGYMTRPFCVKELRWAKLYGCALVGVVEKDSRHGPADFGLEARRAPADLKHVLNDVEFIEYRRRGFEAEAMLAEIIRRCGSSGALEPAPEEPAGVPSVLLPGPRERAHIAHLTGVQLGEPAPNVSVSEPQPELVTVQRDGIVTPQEQLAQLQIKQLLDEVDHTKPVPALSTSADLVTDSKPQVDTIKPRAPPVDGATSPPVSCQLTVATAALVTATAVMLRLSQRHGDQLQ
jgi:hypothetical protein